MNKEEIGKLLKDIFKQKSCDFYRGAKRIEVKDVESFSVFESVEGEYNKDYNYMVRGGAEFFIVDSITGNLISNGIEYFSTFIQVIGNKIKSIDRVNISCFVN